MHSVLSVVNGLEPQIFNHGMDRLIKSVTGLTRYRTKRLKDCILNRDGQFAADAENDPLLRAFGLWCAVVELDVLREIA